VAAKTIDGSYVPGLSVARGNIVLADHGRTIRDERLPPAPSTGRYRPRLLYADITFRAPYDHRRVRSQAATGMLEQTPTEALPAVTLLALGDAETGASASPARGQAWTARPDLLSSGVFTPGFVIETGNEGEIEIRFGDGCHGKRPFPGTRFKAAYRVGNGPYGNVGAETITHVVSDDGRITGVRNPMPARGGSERESIESVRLCASEDFREQRRCITEGDYSAAAERHPDVHQARARLRWTGSWHTVFIHVHRRTAGPVDDGFRRELENRLEPLRAAGRDLAIRAPQYVPVLLGLIVEVAPNHARNTVRRMVLDALGNRPLRDGLRGLFHPENLGFGESLHQSQVVARAQEVSGVTRVEVDRFQRGDRPGDPRLAERLSAGPLEVLRLDNDPQAPQYGTLVLTLRGGLS